VPIIRLRVEEEAAASPCRYRDPGNPSAGVLTAPVLRLTTVARIEPGPHRTAGAVRATTALVDTGAWLSVVETQAWEDYERAGLLERLPLEAGAGHSAAIGGRGSGYLLGRLWVSLYDFRPGRPPAVLPAVPVVAQLLTNRHCTLPYPLVLGLHLGALDGRRLAREPVAVPAAPRPPHHSTDCGAWHGQQWYLESA
jgi:hypothetical protein